MSTEETKKIVADFFEHFSAADVSSALDVLDDAVVWRVMGREGGLPMSGEMNKEAIGALIGSVKEAIPAGMKLTPTGWTVDGDRVALEMESYGEMSNGKVYNNFYHFLVIVSDGKIVTLREYMDIHQVKQLFIDN
ncbi:MAG: nuclear transport factor 2 family protein [Cyanobacteria bacterium J06633_2]